MKKVVSLILVLVMTAALLCTPAFAADSKQDLVEVEVEGATITASEAPLMEAEEMAVVVAEATDEDKAAFEAAGVDLENAVVTPVAQYDVVVEEGKEASATIELEGVEDVICVYLKTADGRMILLGVGKPPLKVTFTESGVMITSLVTAK